MTSGTAVGFEADVDRWRQYVRRRRAVHAADIEELEGHLRDHVTTLVSAGLSDDEAFLVAVKRMGNVDALSREFAVEHAERLWKQLVVPASDAEPRGGVPAEARVVLALAFAAAIAVKLPELFGHHMAADAERFYPRNISFFVLPLFTAYFAWKRAAGWRHLRGAVVAFVGAAVLVNAFPFVPTGATARLTALHLPIALWLAVGIAYAGGRWSDGARRMDFVRFSGEWFIYYVLMACGGGVLTGFTVVLFSAIHVQVGPLVGQWLIPCGALGAVIVAAWLVEAKQSVVENMAPVLTRLFTPLFAAIMLIFLGTLAWTGHGIDVARDVLIAFDVLLAVVIGLLLYAVSARDPAAPADAFDILQLMLVVCALAVDVVALAAVVARLSEYGFSANRVAALGENLILLVNLVWSAWVWLRFVRGRGAFSAMEGWQTAYLPVYSIWAGVVVTLFPPLFGFQ